MKRNLLMMFFLMVLAPVLNARDVQTNQDSTMSFSLKEAQKYALEHNRTLQNAALAIRQAEADKWSSIASMLPQVNGNLSYSDLMGYEMAFAGGSIAMPAYGMLGISVSMAVSGAQVIGAQIAKLSVRMSDINQKQTEQEIVEQVKLLYFSALVSEQTIGLLEKNMETLKKLHEFSKRSVEVGVAEQVDADQLLVQLATLETSINAAKRSLEMVYNSMRLQMNVGFDKEVILTDSLAELLDVSNAMSLVYEDFILENNYSYQLVLQNTELARKQKQLSAWAYGPTLSASYQYSAKKYFSNEMTMNMTPPNMIGLTLSIPIFSSGKNFMTLKNSRLAYQQQLNTLADTEMSLMIQHRQLKYNLSSAYEKFETQKKSVEVSQSVFDNISKKYEFGYSSSLDVTNATTNLINAQSSYVQSVLEFVTAQTELEKLLNRNIEK